MGSSTFRLSTAFRHGRTKIDDIYFEAPFKLMTPFTNGRHSDFVVMLASPGFLKDDEAHISIDFGPGTDSTIKTQSYEKVFDTGDGSAERTIDLTVHGDAKAVFLPFPVIPFKNSSFMNLTTAHVSAESAFVYADVVTCGRVGMDERWAMKRFTNRMRVYVAEPKAVTKATAAEFAQQHAHRRGRPSKEESAAAQPREHLAFADRMLLEPDAFDYTDLGMWREFTHCGVLYAHLPELDPDVVSQAPADGGFSVSPATIRERIESARIAAEDALIGRIHEHADAIGFTGELGVSRVVNGICLRVLTARGDDAFDLIRDVADFVTDFVTEG